MISSGVHAVHLLSGPRVDLYNFPSLPPVTVLSSQKVDVQLNHTVAVCVTELPCFGLA